MKTIDEMNIEELREEVARVNDELKAAVERAEKAEKDSESCRLAYSYVSDENDVMKKKIESLKTIVSLL